MDCLETRRSTLLDFGVSDDEAFAVGLACGGRIRVLVEPVGTALKEDMLATLVAARAARDAVLYAVDTDIWERHLVPASPSNSDVQRRMFRTDTSGFEGAVFYGVHNPPLRLLIVGAVHIAQPLTAIARMAGYDPVLIDPRAAFASDTRFPGEALHIDYPDDVLNAIGIDARTAVITLSHDPKIDDPALTLALPSAAFYVGALGSTRTHAKRVDRLLSAGVSEADMNRLHAPIGLDVGAATPTEIAVAVMAEITQVLRQPS
jgi:xanthine dehydrogenase accessory factor